MMDSETQAEQVRMCASCPKMCRHICPTFNAWRSDSPTPHGRALLLHYENIGTRKLDKRAIEVLYQCLECSHCLTWCVPGIDIASIIESARTRIVSQNRHPKELDRMRDSIINSHNPFDEPHANRNSWFHPKRKGVKSIIYFSGCTASYREQSIAKDTVELLEFLDYRVNLSPDEFCCGSPLFRTGFDKDARSQAEHNVKVLNSMDGDIIVATCPGCYRALVDDYSLLGFDLNKPVEHISQLLDHELQDTKDLMPGKRITYHDPCHLGRHRGEYEAPRSVIKKITGHEPIEMERNRDNATCCGNGAGLRTLFPEYAQKIGSSRLQDARQIEAELIVTACPFCKNMLEKESKEQIEVLDLPELVLGILKSREAKHD
ncbi:MAG: (Fe-S)-binding protein [Candidatus Thorarchaeota archaeon]